MARTRMGSLLVLAFGMLIALMGLGSPATAAEGTVEASAAQRGYVLVDTAGVTTGFGDAAAAGSLSGTTLRAPIVDAESTPTGLGHVMAAADGGVFTFGDAPFFGSLAGAPLNAPIVGIDVTRSGEGYILFAADGGVFTFGDAPFRGSLGGLTLNKPIVDGALNKANDGYILTAADGGVFTFGNTSFGGSMVGTPLNGPVVEIMMADEGPGYALIADDGGIFTFNGFAFYGSLGGMALNAPITDAAPSSTGDGYNLLGADGGVFAFGDAPFAGSRGGSRVPRPLIAILGLANESPVARADSYTATEDTVLTRSAAQGVLANDTDDDGDPLTASLVTGPTKGTLTLNSDGSFSYTPNADANGPDSFTYRATDSNDASDTATATINVAPVNDAPVADDDSYTTAEDAPLVVAAPGVLDGDTDIDGDELTVTVLDDVDHGTLTLGSDGGLTYTPTLHYNGPDAFTYTVSDGNGGTDTGAVSLTVNAVNDAPVAINDAYNTNEDTPLNVVAPGVLANDTDAESSPITAVLVAGPSHGTITLNANGSFAYTPVADYNGLDSFTYKATDGTTESSPATVTLGVAPVNDAPVAGNDAYSTDEDVPLNVVAPGVLADDADVDNTPLTAVLEVGPANGTLTLNANGSFTYAPNQHFNGSDSFTYRATDGTATSNIATVTLTVDAVNDAPAAADDAYNTDEDTPLNVVAPGVLADDSDVEGSPLTAVPATGPSNGTLTLNANGSFVYTPAADYTGGDSFTYKANDGTADSNLATVTLTVGPVNDAPVAVDNAYNTDEDVPLNVVAPGVLANDTDADGNPLTAVLVAGPSNGTLTLNADGSFTYAPTANYAGSDSFTYKADDGPADSNTATVTLTVGPVNDGPVAVDDAYNTDEDTPLVVAAAGVLANDTDAEGPLSATSFGDAVNGTVVGNADGSFTFTPTANFAGTASFGYTVSDGTLTDAGSVTVTVAPVADAPVATNDSYSTDEDLTLNVAAPAVLGNDNDADGDALTAVLVGGPANGTLTLNPNGSFTYSPNPHFNGTDTFTYRANDGSLAGNIATVTITVNPIADAPIAVDDGPFQTTTNTNLVRIAPGVLANDTDADGQALTAGNASDPEHGTVVLDPNGSFTYTPDTGFEGTDTFTYDVSDGTATDTGTVTINVVPPNATPTADATSASGNEDGGAITVTLTGHDADDHNLTFTVGTASKGLVTEPAPGSIDCTTVANTCTTTVTYTPTANYNGGDSFTYTVNDGFAMSEAATATMTVNPVNDEPSFTKGADQTVNEDSGARTVNGWATAISSGPADESGQTVTFTVTTDNDGLFSALPAVSSAGTLTYTANANANGSATVSVTPVDDGAATSPDDDTGATQTFTITVTPVNDVPSFTKGSDVMVNEDAGAQSISNWASAISKGPGDESGQSLSFTTSNDNNALFSVQPGVTPTGTLVYTTAPNAVGSATVTISLSDNGGTANGGDDTSDSQTFTITASPVNDEPSFTKGADETVLEDSGARTAAGWASARSAGPADESAQTVTIERVSTSNDALFSVLPAVAANGDLTYTPAVDANGIATVTLRATDDGGTANGGDATGANVTFDITVTAVNDVPSFTKGADQTVNEDAGAQSVSNWATALSKGPANESAQTLSFEVTGNDNAALFSAAPAVSSTGTLTFTSAANKHGVANVTLRVKDDGGTANGGVDTSATQTFVITVNAVNDAPVAAAKAFTVQSNMKITLSGLLTGATDPNDVAGDPAWAPTYTLGSITAGAGCVGCTISNVNNATGSFDFDPPAGGTGEYTVTYTVVDSGHPAPGVASAPQTITFTVNGPVIWFVDTTVGAGGTGRLSAPFNTLGSATTAMGTDTNERIFVRGGNVTGNVTLPTDGWLISEAATGTNFDDVMGLGSTVPAGTIARPAVNGTQRTLTGTVTLGTNSVVRGFDISPASGSAGLVGSGRTGLVVNQVSVTTTNARAVDLANSSGTFTLKKVQATGATRGLSLVNVNTSTGSFTVTGDGTPNSGGIITGSTAAGTAGAPEGGIHLDNTREVSLTRMTVSNGTASGIYGNNVTTFSLTDSTVSDNGTNETLDHSGIRFHNLLGTSSMTRVTVSGSREDNAKVLNTTGTATLTVSDSTFRDNNAAVGANGLYVDASGSANVTFTSNNNFILRNHTSGLAIFGQSSVKMNVTVNGGTYVTDNGVGLDIETNGSGGMAFNVNGGTVTGCNACGVPVNVYKGTGATGTGVNATAGTINGMTVTNGGSLNAPGIWVHGEGPGASRIAITNNNVSQVGHYGIHASFGNNGAAPNIGAQTADVTVTGNTVNHSGVTGSLEGIFVDSGLLSADTTSTCAHIATNTITQPADDDIRVRNRQAGTSLRLAGYVGGATDHTAVANFLKAQNSIADAFSGAHASSTGITGGSSCLAP